MIRSRPNTPTRAATTGLRSAAGGTRARAWLSSPGAPTQPRRDRIARQARTRGQELRALLDSRQNTSPRRLTEPGPKPSQLRSIFHAAAAAPDHGRLLPWRFIVVAKNKRSLLADAFALALIDRDADAGAEQIDDARAKAYRAPLLMLAVATAAAATPLNIPVAERLVSLGCAVQNMLLAAHSMGFGSGLVSGQAMASERLHRLFRLRDGESAVCFLAFGSVSQRRPQRARPKPAQFVSSL